MIRHTPETTMTTAATRVTRPPKDAPAPVADPSLDRGHRVTVEQYHGMIDAGILGEDERCELIHGWIIDKMPPNPPHTMSARRVTRRLLALFTGDQWVAGGPQPVTLTDSQPEPDFAVVVGPE